MGKFFAFISRMKFINRWSLMRNTQTETLSDHTVQVAFIAHGLAVIGNKRLRKNYNQDRVAVLALYHDVTEILTGDMPTPIKYYNPELRNAYKAVEKVAGNKLLDMLPQELRSSYEAYVLESDRELEPIVKAADKLAAHIKCIEELKAGNSEFSTAATQTLEALRGACREELTWFLDNCLEPFGRNLDQL